jgi:hypothetical protein
VTSSLPAHLLRAPGSQPGSPPRGRDYTPDAPVAAGSSGSGGEAAPPVLVAAPGQPGEYDPAVSPEGRPRSLAELSDRYQPATTEPWPAGSYVLMGTSGKRAHWTGDRWKGGDSPGYRHTVTVGDASTSGDAESTAQELSTRTADESEDPEDDEL